jgi:hypothetical protein
MAMLLFRQKQCKKYTIPLHVLVSDALLLVMDCLNIYEFKVTSTMVA